MQKATPIIPYMGGKRRLLKYILPMLPPHQCYVEPFCGGAAVLWAKEPVQAETINDIDGEIINLYRVVKNHLDEFVRQFRWSLASRQLFEWAKMTAPETLTDIQRAARFFYLQKLTFGGIPHGTSYGTATTSGVRFNILRIEEELSAAHIRLSRVNIENLDWQSIIKKYDRPHTFFFCDPPYWQTADYGNKFDWHNYEAMAEMCDQIQGAAMVTLNDHPDIRSLFAHWHCRVVPIRYTVGGTDKCKKTANEIILTNYTMPDAAKK